MFLIIWGRGFSVQPCMTHVAFGLTRFMASITLRPALL